MLVLLKSLYEEEMTAQKPKGKPIIKSLISSIRLPHYKQENNIIKPLGPKINTFAYYPQQPQSTTYSTSCNLGKKYFMNYSRL